MANTDIAAQSDWHIYRDEVVTPAFIFDIASIVHSVSMLQSVLANRSASILYSIKACSSKVVIEAIAESIDGFSASSPNEAHVASSYMNSAQELHVTSPGLCGDWFERLPGVTHVAFNSITQYDLMYELAPASMSLGIRVNPGISTVIDKRYDPCSKHSKLGVPIVEFEKWITRAKRRDIEGIHFHSECLCQSWEPLLKTVKQLESRFSSKLSQMKWINLGGGYVWDESTDFGPLQEAVHLLTTKYGLQVFLEPGAALVNSAGYLVASVIDLFDSDGKTVAVLDTTVNHLPEVFEYQYEPDIVGHVDDAPHEYILAGCSCLAGDLFGEYSFEYPLEIGSRVTFANVGAYSLVKANMFNGINLPTIYTLAESGELVLTKQFTYEDFASRCGVDTNAAIRV